MSWVRGLGRRERVARKRYRRTVEKFFDGSEWRTCKLGRKKGRKSLSSLFRSLKTSSSSVGDTRKGTTGAQVAEAER